MALMPNVEEQEVLADTYRRADAHLSREERRGEVLIGVAFVLAVSVLWLLSPPQSFDPLPAALCFVVLVLATRVRFDTPFGFTVATQLAFVPLLFAMPVVLVPLAVALGLATAPLPEVLRRKQPPERLLFSLGNAWFAIGPVAVFVLTDTAPHDAGAALLLAALAAQFAVDFGVSVVRFRLDREATFAAQLRETWVYGIDAALSGVALVIAEDVQRTPIVALTTLPLLALLSVFARERHERMGSLLELNNAYRGTALVLADVVEADDGYTGEHIKGVVLLALQVGEELGLDPEQMRNLEFGALLHDVGKIAIPKEIINKPGKLDPDEWKIIETHTIEGQKMLNRVGGFMQSVGLIVRSHHERWDGRGYPDGLVGEDIPLEARIVTCCDSWNAMRTDRAYRKALSHEVARAELVANSGHQFDPRVVVAFLQAVEGSETAEPDYPAASRVESGEGRLTNPS